MRKVIKIDPTGLFIEDVLLEDSELIPNDCIEIPCQEGFYKPKWDGSEWVEGLAQIEIDNIKNKPKEPTQEDRLVSIESAITALMGV